MGFQEEINAVIRREVERHVDRNSEVIDRQAAILFELRGKLESAENERDALQRKVEDTEALMLAMRDDSIESRSKLELVVAENAAMKQAIEFATADDMWIEQHDGMLDYRYKDWYVDVLNQSMDTPTTDAMVNEIRAEGIEAWIASRNGGWNGTTKQAEAFASQLRADAAKGGSDD